MPDFVYEFITPLLTFGLGYLLGMLKHDTKIPVASKPPKIIDTIKEAVVSVIPTLGEIEREGRTAKVAHDPVKFLRGSNGSKSDTE